MCKVIEPKVKVKVIQSCPTLCNPMDCSLPGSSVHGILQARILEWVAVPFVSGSSQPRNRTGVSCHCRWILYQLSYQRSPYKLNHYLIPDIFITPIRNTHPLAVTSLLTSKLFTTICLLSVSFNLPILNISYTWNHTVLLSCVDSSTYHNFFQGSSTL